MNHIPIHVRVMALSFVPIAIFCVLAVIESVFGVAGLASNLWVALLLFMIPFLCMANILVFTSVKSAVRFFVYPAWILVQCVLLGAFVWYTLTG